MWGPNNFPVLERETIGRFHGRGRGSLFGRMSASSDLQGALAAESAVPESSVTGLPLGSKATSAGKAQAVSLHGTSYMGSPHPTGEGKTHAHPGPSPGHSPYPAGTIPPHTTGPHQGEPTVLAGSEQAKPYDQDRPTQDPPERLCMLRPHLFKGGRWCPGPKPKHHGSVSGGTQLPEGRSYQCPGFSETFPRLESC